MPPLKGRIAYVQDNNAYIEPAAGGKAPLRLPGSSGVSVVTVSPADGMTFYFSSVSGMPFDPVGPPRDELMRAFFCPPPYDTARALPPPVDRVFQPQAFWTPDGNAALFRTGSALNPSGYIFFPAKQTLQPLPYPFVSASRDVRWGIARQTPGGGVNEIRLWGVPPRKERALLDNRNPEVLEAVLRAAGVPSAPPKGVPARPRSWAFALPALSPDGATAYVAAHDSTGNPYRLFALDTATGKVRLLLARLGDVGGRQHPLLASPDGKRLLWENERGQDSASGNAVVVDLATRKMLPVPTDKDPERRGGSRRPLTAGACWSPDGQHFAVAVGYYGGKERGPQRYDIRLCEAATGRVVRTIRNALRPSWGA